MGTALLLPLEERKRPIPTSYSPPKLLISCSDGLPICDTWENLLCAIRQNQVIIVSGETGSGKTTQIPKICLEAGRKRIACTQPRRVAAITVAARVAEELGPCGQRLVGYKIRFRDRTGPDTRIKFVTDGMLLAEVQHDPEFRAYDTIIVDEAHERSLNIDFLLGILRKVLISRPELKVIITSATIDTAHFCRAFGNAPVIEIAGRGYPVEIRYRPREDEDITTVERIVAATSEVRREDPFGDILIFLPTEREIQETVRILRSACGDRAIVLPMYGRLAAIDQRRIFRHTSVQKIVVATNVAETSITVPGIRYVIDSGLARISRYNVRSHTKALPISPISRASADQRAGRAGRVQSGVCIRLYNEEDYLDRPKYTLPEIQRSNLSEVILRLLAMGQGPVDQFPFVDAPSPQAIREGFATLRELGAIDAAGRLTRMGRMMARLPLDPRISRMILQARNGNALKEVVIIASAMSIQDPRERPADREGQADQAHSAFKDPSSDLSTFVRIWNVYQRELETGRSRNQMRRFCRDQFLSYNRMQEWRDIYDQIRTILKKTRGFSQIPKSPRPEVTKALSRQIHCAVLSGFLGQIALKQEGTRYLAARGREVFLFPGSSIYKKRPKWIVATEIVRTSMLFARTVATIEPEWIEDLAGDLCRYSYSEPHWEKRRGEVRAWEKVTLFGLPIVERRKVSYGKIDPEETREIFIRQALIPGELRGRYPFLEHNMELISEVQDLENRTRRRGIMVDEEVLYSLYDAGLREIERNLPFRIFSERSLARALRIGRDDRICFKKEDLLRATPAADEVALFPGHIEVSGQIFSLSYRFCPGDEADGVTVEIPVDVLSSLSPGPFEWLVPGLLEEKILFFLRSLPKQVRKKLVPIPRAAEKITQGIRGIRGTLLHALERVLFREYGLHIDREMWSDTTGLPKHLLMRFELLDHGGQVIDSGRDLCSIKERWKESVSKLHSEDPGWLEARAKWEVSGISLKDLPELPGKISISPQDYRGAIQAFPGLVLEDKKTVGVRLFGTSDKALSETQEGARQLLADSLAKELRYLKRNCVPGGLVPEAYMAFGGIERLRRSIYAFLCRELLGAWGHIPTRSDLLTRARELEGKIFLHASPIIDLLREILGARLLTQKEIEQLCPQSRKDLEADLERLTPRGFPIDADMERLLNLPRYLKALCIRAERAYVDPSKDRAKASRLKPFLLHLKEARAFLGKNNTAEFRAEIGLFERLLEEYRVSVFAPEVGTAEPVSPRRLSEEWKRLKDKR